MGVSESLLYTSVDRVVVVLGFDDGNRDIGLVVEDVVSALLRTSRMKFSSDINSPVSEADFFPKLRLYVPTRRHEAWG